MPSLPSHSSNALIPCCAKTATPFFHVARPHNTPRKIRPRLSRKFQRVLKGLVAHTFRKIDERHARRRGSLAEALLRLFAAIQNLRFRRRRTFHVRHIHRDTDLEDRPPHIAVWKTPPRSPSPLPACKSQIHAPSRPFLPGNSRVPGKRACPPQRHSAPMRSTQACFWSLISAELDGA